MSHAYGPLFLKYLYGKQKIAAEMELQIVDLPSYIEESEIFYNLQRIANEQGTFDLTEDMPMVFPRRPYIQKSDSHNVGTYLKTFNHWRFVPAFMYEYLCCRAETKELQDFVIEFEGEQINEDLKIIFMYDKCLNLNTKTCKPILEALVNNNRHELMAYLIRFDFIVFEEDTLIDLLIGADAKEMILYVVSLGKLELKKKSFVVRMLP